MDIAYKIMFIVGVLYTFVSIIISGISGALHLGHHIGHVEGHIGGHNHCGHVSGHHGGHTGDVNGHGTQAGHDSGVSHTFLSWFAILINPLVAVSFLTVFGGIGILGTEYFKWVATFVFVVALASGIIVSVLLYKYIAIPLYKSENSTDVSREDLVSTMAEVISTILEGGFGKIRYTVNDIRYTAPAKHIEGKAVVQGKKVVICKIDNSVFYVSEMEEI